MHRKKVSPAPCRQRARAAMAACCRRQKTSLLYLVRTWKSCAIGITTRIDRFTWGTTVAIGAVYGTYRVTGTNRGTGIVGASSFRHFHLLTAEIGNGRFFQT